MIMILKAYKKTALNYKKILIVDKKSVKCDKYNFINIIKLL